MIDYEKLRTLNEVTESKKKTRIVLMEVAQSIGIKRRTKTNRVQSGRSEGLMEVE